MQYHDRAFKAETIEAGFGYIVRWEGCEGGGLMLWMRK